MIKRLSRFGWLLASGLALLLLNIVGSFYHVQFDLTEDKRFTLSDATETLLEELQTPVYIQILLSGEFPAGFRRLQQAAEERLQDFQQVNGYIEYAFVDPLEGDPQTVKERLEEWAEVGITPTELNVKDAAGQSRKQIFPFAIFNLGDRQIAINLLEGNSEGMSPEVALNNSIILLEYKFANAIAKLQAVQKPNVLFTTGHGELTPLQTASLRSNLRAFYNTADLHLDSVIQIPEEIDLVIIAKPTQPFSDKDLFKIDQYAMRGGRLIFLIDPLVVNLDSIARNGQYVPFQNQHGLDDMLFTYGCRVNPNLVLDLESSYIPLTTGATGGQEQPRLFQWYYHPLASGVGEHPIVKGLDRVDLQFPATIDTLKTRTTVIKIPVLRSSPYSRLQFSPVILDFSILGREPDPQAFDAGPQDLAILLEGNFPSLYSNRVSDSMQEGLRQLNIQFQDSSIHTRMLIVADGDIAKNLVNPLTNQIRPLGYNQYMNYTFDNLDFLTNAIEYMLDRRGLMEARSKNIKLRLLDQPRMEAERTQWQLFNVGLPLLSLLVLAWLIPWIRKRKYAQQ